MAGGRFSIEAIFRARDRMQRPIAMIERRLERMTRRATLGMRALDRSFGAVHRGIKRIGTAFLAVGAAGAVVGRQIIGVGAGFEQAITNVAAVGLQTREQIADLEARALQLGKTTKFTATEAANAMEIMARAGFENEEILGGVEGVLNAAAASGLEMAEVADVVSNALKGMGLETTDAARVADVLALASSRTNSTIGTLGESIRNVAATARQLNVPFEEVTAGVALLQDVGLDASVAGSSLNTMLTKMAKPTSTVAAQMRRFGITFKDAHGNMLPFAKVLEQLDIAGKKAGGNFDKIAFLADLVGLRGQKAAANLADLFASGKFATLTEELQGASGAASKMAAIRMDTVQGEWTLLRSAIDGVTNALFGLEGGALKDTIARMREWVGANEKVIVSGVQEFIADVRENLPTIVTWLKRVGVGVAAFYTLSAAVKVANVALGAMNLIMAANPFVLLAAAVVGAGVLIYKFWDDIKLGFEIMKESAVRAIDAIGEFLLGALALLMPATVDLVVSNWSTIKDFFVDLWGFVLQVGRNSVDEIVSDWAPLVDFFMGVWSAIADGFQAALGWVFDALGWAVDKVRALGAEKASEAAASGAAPHANAAPQVIGPEERVARQVSESISESREQVDITIKDDTGRAEVKRTGRRGRRPRLQPSGAF